MSTSTDESLKRDLESSDWKSPDLNQRTPSTLITRVEN